MAVLTPEDVLDLVVATQADLGRNRVTDLSTDIREYVAFENLMQKNRVEFRGGTSIQFNVRTGMGNNTRNSGLFDVDNLNQTDNLTTGSVPWRFTVGGWTHDIRQAAMNMGPNRVVDFVKEKETEAMIDWVDHFESQFWGEPASSTDETTPYGIKYWLVYNASTGFNGGNNTNFSSGPAGINRDTYARWKNYTFSYTNVSATDLIRKLRGAMTYCGFKPPIRSMGIPQYGETTPRWMLCTSYDVVQPAEEMAMAQNDANGNDLAARDGVVTVRRVPLVEVPYLTANESTADPVVGIDWNQFKTIYLSGYFMRRTPAHRAPTQHMVMQSFTDSTYNWVSYNCRKMFLGAKATWHS